MKILLLGKNGQVGWELARLLPHLGELVAIGRDDLDLIDQDQLRQTIRSIEPEIIVNAAAYTAVDKAESDPELAMAINAVAPGIIAEEAKNLDCAVVHYSTDYVFDGAKHSPYVETDLPNPINVYGRSKLAGEQAVIAAGAAHLIFRTSWVYSNRGSNFLHTVKRLLREKKELRIVDDQVGAPTWARDIAEGTSKAISCYLKKNTHRTQMVGVYHLSAAGQTSWYDFAEQIISAEGKNVVEIPRLLAIKTSEYPTPARRPAYSVLSNKKFGNTFHFALPHWKENLRRALCE